MDHQSAPAVKRLLLIGGGHSHLAVLKHFAMRPLPGLAVTLVSKDILTPYSGALGAHLAGWIGRDDMHIDLRPLANAAGASLIQGEVEGLDPVQQQVFIRGRPALGYDILSINCGSHPDSSSIDGAAEHATGLKPIAALLQRWQALQQQVPAHTGDTFRLAFVGAGPAAIEIALSMQAGLQQLLTKKRQNPHKLAVHILEAEDQILQGHNARFRELSRRLMADRGIHLHLQHQVKALDGKAVHCTDADSLPADEVFLSTAAAPPAWLAASGLSLSAKGFIGVNPFLQSMSHPNVFAAGDVADMLHSPRPKAGVFAVRQGMPLAKNLRRFALGKKLRVFRPQQKALVLMGTGKKFVLASRGNWAAQGKPYWWLKNHLDGSFVDKYSRPPAMKNKTGIHPRLLAKGESPPDQMRCLGCGAKIGAGILQQSLPQATGHHDHILHGLEAREDAAVLKIPAGKLLLQTVDFMPAFIKDAYLFGRIAAEHCLSDIYAMGGKPDSALATVVVPVGGDQLMTENLTQVMAGACEVLKRHNTALIGGHSLEGENLGLGLTVNGLGEEETLLLKQGAEKGDLLILTKALGTGTLLAADRQGQARGDWIEEALQEMLLSNRDAAACFLAHGAHALTDITGFGLLGHLTEMLEPVQAHAELYFQDLPLLKGAKTCLERAFLSSLHRHNLRFERYLIDSDNFAAQKTYPILFDPQTSGGLLGALPRKRAEDCLQAMKDQGIKARVIGKVETCGQNDCQIKLV